MSNKQKGRLLSSMILLTGALLLVSLLNLGVRIVETDARISETEEPFPALYAASNGDYMEPGQKTVYFTFDDGPSKNTEVLLDMLAEESVKATFFVCAQYDDKEFSAQMLRRMRDEGHTIALHSYSHKYEEIYASLEEYLQDLAEINDFVFLSTGLCADIVRFPGGSKTSRAEGGRMRQIAGEVTRRGYVFYDWTVPSGDDKSKPLSAIKIADNIMNGVKGKQVEIILCHDNATPTTTPEAVRIAIGKLREEGYAFDRLTPGVPPVQLIYR